jgi:hypothetical protein
MRDGGGSAIPMDFRPSAGFVGGLGLPDSPESIHLVGAGNRRGVCSTSPSLS